MMIYGSSTLVNSSNINRKQLWFYMKTVVKSNFRVLSFCVCKDCILAQLTIQTAAGPRSRMKRDVGVAWLNRHSGCIRWGVWLGQITGRLRSPPAPQKIRLKCSYLCAAGQTSQLDNSWHCLCFICSATCQICVTNKHAIKQTKCFLCNTHSPNKTMLQEWIFHMGL